ncbi:MAG: RNA-binding protein [Thermoplasmatota archaeon]
MDNLGDIAEKIEVRLNEKDALREATLKQCRDIIRYSRKCISLLHNEAVEEAADMAAKAHAANASLKEDISEHPDIRTAGYMENASQELAEAHLFLAIYRGEDLPSPEDLGITYTSYLLGLGDVVGELRRRAVNLLRDGDVGEVEHLLQLMEAICDHLMEFDYPSGLVPVKRKQDIAKKILERLRGEVVMYKKNRAVEEKIDLLLRHLQKGHASSDDDFDLDVNSVW